MPNRIVWSQNAQAQFRSTVRYWDRRNQSQFYTKRLTSLVLRQLRILRQFPTAFPEATPGIRKMTVENFVMLNTVNKAVIVLLHFYDSRQNGPLIGDLIDI